MRAVSPPNNGRQQSGPGRAQWIRWWTPQSDFKLLMIFLLIEMSTGFSVKHPRGRTFP